MKTMKGARITLFSMMFLASAASSQAGPIFISNFGFEDTDIGIGGIVNGDAPGWTVSNGFAGVWHPGQGATPFFNNGAPEGTQFLFVGFEGGAADVSQTLGATVEANTTYALSFYLGQRLDLALSTDSVSLLWNGRVLASDATGTTTPGNFTARTITFNSGANPDTLGQTLGISIHASGLRSGQGAQAEFDSFSFSP